MIVNYEEIKRYFDNRYSDSKARKYSNMLCKIEELIDINALKLFYPKNLFIDDKDLEAYFIFKDKILSGRILEENIIEITSLRFKDLTDYKCEYKYVRDGLHRLTMEFKNGKIVVFDSVEDTNTSWGSKFNNQIKELFKLLIKDY